MTSPLQIAEIWQTWSSSEDRVLGSPRLGSMVPIAAWLNPLLITGYAVEVSKNFHIQPRGMGSWIECTVASGLTEEAQAVRGFSAMLILTLKGIREWKGTLTDCRGRAMHLDVASKCVLGAKALRATQRAR
jgi:hypothetical protein